MWFDSDGRPLEGGNETSVQEEVGVKKGDVVMVPLSLASGTGYQWKVLRQPSFLGSPQPLQKTATRPGVPGAAIREGWWWRVEDLRDPSDQDTEALVLSFGRPWLSPAVLSV